MISIVPYESKYEKSWVYTKAISYVFTDFYDDPSRIKDLYNAEIYRDTVELVALEGEQVVGLVDMAIFHPEIGEKNLYYPCAHLATFTNFAVHPDFQQQGIGWQLVQAALKALQQKGVEALMIYTRGDEAANAFYHKLGATLICQNYRVRGTAKTEADFRFTVNRAVGKLELKNPEEEDQLVPYYLAEGTYIVPDKADLALFDEDEILEDRTYLYDLTKKENLDAGKG